MDINGKILKKIFTNLTMYQKQKMFCVSGMYPQNARLDQHSEINLIHHINKLEKKNHIISIHTDNTFDKIQHILTMKALMKQRLESFLPKIHR